MEPLTGLATGSVAANSVFIIIQILFVIFGYVFIAASWFAIAHRARIRGAWLAFIPLFGMIVPWRIARTPRWTLITGMIAALLVPIGVIVSLTSIALVFGFVFSEPGALPESVSLGPFVALGAISVMITLIAWVAYTAISAWWSARVAQALGFSTWVGLLASPLTALIPEVGFIARLVFVGLIAYKKEPF
jgi:hypothetical protein